MAELRRAAEEGRLRGLQGLGERSEEKILAGARAGRRRGRAAPRPARDRPARSCATSSSAAPRAPGRGGGLGGRKRPPPPRDVPRPRRDRHRHRSGGADVVLHDAARRARGRRARRHEGHGRDAARAPARPASRAARVLRRPAAAFHRVEGAQHRAAGGGRPPRALDLRVRRHGRRDGRGEGVRHGRGALRASSATSSSRRSCARTPASSRPPVAASCPLLVEQGDLRGELHCHSTWSSDGKDTIEAMALAARARGYRYLVRHRPLPLPARRAAAGAVGGDRGRRRAAAPVSRAARDRGQHPRRRDASTSPTRTSPSSTGWSRRCTRRSTATRPSASSPRSTTRTSTASVTSPARKLSRPQRAKGAPIDVELVVARAAETGHGARDQQPARPARPARRPCAAGRRGRRARAGEHRRPLHQGTRLRGARRRAGPARLADEGAGAQHAHVGADRED